MRGRKEKEEAVGGGGGGGGVERERGPIWSILALDVRDCVDPSEKEGARKETWDRVGRGVTDNILFNYCLNKNIVFLKEVNQLKSNKTREKKK